jgi:hypothetical protein
MKNKEKVQRRIVRRLSCTVQQSGGRAMNALQAAINRPLDSKHLNAEIPGAPPMR